LLQCYAPPQELLLYCLPLDIKDLLKEDAGFFDGGLMEGFFDGGWTDWWAACENDAGELC
jgi:hypothetical protein